MSKTKYLVASLFTLSLLASCGNNGNPNSSSVSVTPSSDTSDTSGKGSSTSKSNRRGALPLAEILAEYRDGLTATGTKKIYYGSEVNSTINFVTKFTKDSYHFEETDGKETATTDLFKVTQNGADYVATTQIDANNEVVYTPVKNDENQLVGWSNVQNPFLDNYTDPGFFDYDEYEGYYYLDFEKDAQKAGNRFQAAVDLMAKFTGSSSYGFDSLEISVEGKKITEIRIVTTSFTLSKENTKAHYEINFTLDNDPTHDHSATKATPYPEMDYHKDLKKGFDKLINTPAYSFQRDASSISTLAMPKLEGYVSFDTFYYDIPGRTDQFSGLIQKDGKVYEVEKDSDGYYYDDTPLTMDSTVLKEIPSAFYPARSEAVEAFTYSDSSKRYILEGADATGAYIADYFSFYFDTFGYILDEDNMAKLTFTSVEVTLNEDDEITSLSLNTQRQGSVIYTFTYDTSLRPFDPASLKPMDIAKNDYGTYVGTFAGDAKIHAGETITIHFSRKENTDKYTKDREPYVYQVTYSYAGDASVYTAQNVSYSVSGGLTFTAGGQDYTLAKKEDGTYQLSIGDDEGNTVTTTMTKSAE